MTSPVDTAPIQIPDGLHWLADLVESHRKIIDDEPFFQIALDNPTLKDFGWARQLLHHSWGFPKLLAHRRDACWDHPAAPSSFFAQHVEEETGHAEMLTDWLEHYELVPRGEEAPAPVPTVATLNCLAQGYLVVDTGTIADNITVLNVVIEADSQRFFSRMYPVLDALGASDGPTGYWGTHVEADIYHSAQGLAYVPPCTPDSPDGRRLARWARIAAIGWGAMLNSWVGVHQDPAIPPAD